MLKQRQILHNRYQLRQRLGQTAGRQTWLAVDTQNQTPVVVKLLTFSDQVQWDQVRLFEREAKILQHLHHPRIPHYHDFFCLDEQLIWFTLVQDYIAGDSLKQHLDQGKVFGQLEVRQIAKQILQILIYLQGLSPPVLHRDIKPSNLILDPDNQVYLVDFGSVQDRVAKEGATFTVVGTYGYAPLEQLGGRATLASDLYALGATLIHLLTGVAPAELPQVNGRLQFADSLNFNPGFVRWLWQLTEANVERRFSTAREALDALVANGIAIYGSVAVRPANSQIQLHKSPQRLELIINNYYKVFGTYLRFDSQSFEICWNWFGLRRRKQGRITDIDQISPGELLGRERVLPAVAITVGVHEHLITSINPSLTPDELRWLLQELRQWLGLR